MTPRPVGEEAEDRPVRLAYQPSANSTFLSEQTSHQQPASSTSLSEQTSTSHQPPAKRTGWMAPRPRPRQAAEGLRRRGVGWMQRGATASGRIGTPWRPVQG
jgi:hypothetical protein